MYGESPYRGRSTVLGDGTAIRTGDRILHLHLDNRALQRLAADGGWSSWRLPALLAADLDVLADQIEAGRLGDVKALRGLTVLAGGALRVGFEVRSLPPSMSLTLLRYVAALVIATYHPHGFEILDRGLPRLGEVWMSRKVLLERTRTKARS